MNYKRFNGLTKEGLRELLIVIKKLGLPLVILGGLFLIYSWIDGKPAVSFSQLIMTFLFLALMQVEFENLWLENEVKEIKKRLKELEEKSQADENK
ncbi:hypothetical protein R9X47_07295 [Wukongibacter baidiensis]|uniref:hypothetical protein n=1 Tax=Wukongibacter baidiensis TaxID=1723361 RepID=UPI003D7FDCA5